MAVPPIRSPQDLRKLSLEDLEALALDIRQAILSACMKNGGHLGASLGAVEIAIALHYVFDSPRDPIVWDVGHQAYAHKLITGRWERFETLRQPGGISGFLSRAESPHDAFGAGHSSTALSAALAMAWARGRGQSEPKTWTVAVMGDGGLTAGLAYEALNNVRATNPGPLLLVLNDNQMSISRNVGAIPAILAGSEVKELFKLFDFDYVGPVNGHDLATLIGTLSSLRDNNRGKPVVLHAFTQKGKGYVPAEERPAAFHGINPLQEKIPDKPTPAPRKTYSEAFGEALCELAERDPAIVAITAAMPEGTGLAGFATRFPDRFFDVGIAEPHAVVFAAGLATQGFRPVVAIYSTFLQRALDQIIHDVALQGLPVTFAIDRAGLVGADGPTHHGAFDLAYLGMVPGFGISAPSCLGDMRELLASALRQPGPWAIRFPRGSGAEALAAPSEAGLRWHGGPEAPRAVVVALGAAASRAIEAVRAVDSDGSKVCLITVTQAKPIPEELITHLRAHSACPLLVVEDGSVRGGFGESLIAASGPRRAETDLAGYGDHFAPHGSPSYLEDRERVSAKKLTDRLSRLLS